METAYITSLRVGLVGAHMESTVVWRTLSCLMVLIMDSTPSEMLVLMLEKRKPESSCTQNKKVDNANWDCLQFATETKIRRE